MKIFDNIMSWKKPEMLDLAKELNIKGRSKMNKGEVAESISEILKPAKSEMVLWAFPFIASNGRVVASPITVAPAAFPDSMPDNESSKTKQFSGLTPMAFAPRRYGCGCGLENVTRSLVITALNLSRNPGFWL